MPNKKLILKRIKKLRDFIAKAKFLQKYSFKEYEENLEINFAIDRELQLLVECSIDLGKDIINSLELEKPENYKHVFVILSQNGIINYTLSKEMQRLTGFRNRLVHAYLYLDLQKIYNVLQKDLKYFEKYLLTIEKFVKYV